MLVIPDLQKHVCMVCLSSYMCVLVCTHVWACCVHMCGYVHTTACIHTPHMHPCTHV